MKNLFFAIGLSIIALTIVSFTYVHDATNTTAEVETVDGYSIFLKCKPVKEFVTLGEVKIKVSMSGGPEELFSQVLKKIKKEYPKADGILFHSIALEKAEAIQFK